MRETADVEGHIQGSTEFFIGADLSPLVARIEANAAPHAAGSPWWVEPEPNETKKRRFRRDVEVPTGYTATFSFTGPGRNDPADSVFGIILFDRPPSAPDRRPELPLAAGWTIDHDYHGDGVLISSENVLATSAEVTARMTIDVLLALGAPLPTGRWRMSEFWIEYRTYEL